MSDNTAVVDTTNPSQSAGPAVPNQDRPKPDAGKTPEQIAAEAKANEGKTPEQLAEEAAAAEAAKVVEAPKVGDEDVPNPDLLEAPTSEDADADGVITYPATGDPGMDMALEFVGKLGIGMDDPAMRATLTGDFSLIRAKLAAMGDKAAGHERMCDLAEDANKRAGERHATASKAIATAVSGVLGETQGEILKWASATATPEEKKSINAMLAADPVQARAAATILLNAYNKASGTVVEPASATRDAAGEAPKPSNSRLTPKEFARECDTLSRKYGGGSKFTQSAEYAALTRRLG